MALFTLTFNPALDTVTYPTLNVSGCNFSTNDNGFTYITNDNPSSLFGFSTTPYLTNLVSVNNIPPSVTSFGNNAFRDCSALTSVTLESGLITIGNAAFRDTGLTSVTIPASVTSFGYEAFMGCSALTSVTLESGLTTIGNAAFRSCIALTSVTLESGLTTIGEFAFRDTGLTSVSIPASVIVLGTFAFSYCSALTSVTLESGLTIIGEFAFENCNNLTSIRIPNSSVTIGSNAFFNIPTYPPEPTLQDAATLYTSPLNESTNSVYAYFKTNFIDGVNQINYINDGPIPPPIPMVCFKEDSKILTKQGYRPIQDLRKGDLIKTIKHGYIPIDMIGYCEIYNPICEERIKDKLYVCTNKEYSEIFEDLVITGCHCILVENYKDQEQLDKSTEVNGGIFETDNKWRLPACVDERAKPYEKEGKYTIYHLALENDDYYMNYGIYANGLIVETCSKRYLKELSNMTLLI